ncbi:hypothetical protein DFH09DRAFT_1150497, partial [Mycena vulgaris]
MAAAAETFFSIQELCDQFTHHIALNRSSQDDLKSIALVCHTLCNSAQSQIFRHIILDTPEVALSTVHRLSTILQNAPQLLRSIHSISVLVTSAILRPLSIIHFPVLRKIRFDFLVTPWEALSDELRFVRDFIGLPSIRDVELANLGMRPDLDQLSFLLDTCTPHLQSFTAINLFPFSNTFTAPVLPPRGRCTKITRLKLDGTYNLDDWLVSPSSPFDITHLVDVEIRARNPSAMSRVLSAARFSITKLAFFTQSVLDINLSDFPALMCLELLVGHSTHHAISSLNLPDNRVQILVLCVWVDAFDGGGHSYSYSFSALDTLVTTSRMPALRRVEVRIVGRLENGSSFQIQSVRSYFPRLDAGGLLVVTDAR